MSYCGGKIERQIDYKHAAGVDGEKLIRCINRNTAVADLGVKRQHRARCRDTLRGIVRPCATAGVQGLTT